MADTLDLLWPVLIPIMTAALTACLWNNIRAQRVISFIGLLLLFAASAKLMITVVEHGVVAKQFGGWAPPFGINFVADPLSAALVAISGLLALSVGIFGFYDVRARHERAGFYPLFHGMITGVNGAFLTGDVFNLYVWFEVMLITSLGLLVISRSREQLDGTIKYGVLNLFGTILFLIGLALLYGAAGTLNMADLARVLPGMTMTPGLMTAAMLFLAAFAIKAGLFPLFFWLPASYHTATFAVGAIFAGLLTKVGVYALFRTFTLLFLIEGEALRYIFTVIAATTMITGVFGAAVQWNIRRILSFHIISQIGYMLMGLAIATPIAWAGASFYIIHHIIVKANLFLLAGAIRAAGGSDDLRQTGGLLKSHPWLAVLFLIPALSLAGVPPLSGFWAKFLVIDASLRSEYYWLAAVALFVGVLTLFSMMKIWMEAFWKASPVKPSRRRYVPVAFIIPIVMLGAVTMTIGLFAEPFVTFARDAGDVLVDPPLYITPVFGAEAAAEAGALIAGDAVDADIIENGATEGVEEEVQ